MEMIRVRSTAIAAIGYDPASKRMKIAFQQSHTYDFCHVPAHIYEGFLRPTSKGSYYNVHIINARQTPNNALNFRSLRSLDVAELKR